MIIICYLPSYISSVCQPTSPLPLEVVVYIFQGKLLFFESTHVIGGASIFQLEQSSQINIAIKLVTIIVIFIKVILKLSFE